MNIFTLTFEKDSKKTLYEQLYEYIVAEIKTGNLKKHEQLPSKKKLSEHLKISINTIEKAYYTLIQEGYVYSKPQSGFFISDIDFSTVSNINFQKTIFKKDEISISDNDFLNTNSVDTDSFPFATWAKLFKETLYNNPNLLNSGDFQGDFQLRKAVCKYLHEFRGVNCDESQIIIGAGIEYLLMLLCEVFDSNQLFAIENPCYKKAFTIIKNSGKSIFPIDLDKNGMNISDLKKSSANLAYITPSHQFPTGIIMPINRRIELLEWAKSDINNYIIEDDYNSEFHFYTKPISSVQGLDNNEKVIYLSTFSRVLSPSIRIAYMLLPYPVLKIFNLKFDSYSSTVSRFEQHTLAKFINDGYFERHINRVKVIYKKRHDFVLNLLISVSKSKIENIIDNGSGLHFLIKINQLYKMELIQKSQNLNIHLNFVSDFYIGNSFGNKNILNILIFGFSGLTFEKSKEIIDLLFN